MCDVNYIKKARYSGQVVAPVLEALLMHPYKEAEEQKTSLRTPTFGVRNRKMKASSISLEF